MTHWTAPCSAGTWVRHLHPGPDGLCPVQGRRVQDVFRGDLRQYRPLYTIDYLPGETTDTVAGMVISHDYAHYQRLPQVDGRYFIITSMPVDTHVASAVLEAYCE